MSDEKVNIARNNSYDDEVFTDARNKYGNEHNTIDNGILNFTGTQIPMENYLLVFNKGAAYRKKFDALSVEIRQIYCLSLDVINIDRNTREKETLEKYTGTNGQECDGCQL